MKVEGFFYYVHDDEFWIFWLEDSALWLDAFRCDLWVFGVDSFLIMRKESCIDLATPARLCVGAVFRAPVTIPLGYSECPYFFTWLGGKARSAIRIGIHDIVPYEILTNLQFLVAERARQPENCCKTNYRLGKVHIVVELLKLSKKNKNFGEKKECRWMFRWKG